MWHTTCSSHTANLLLKDVLDCQILSRVVDICKQMRKPGPAHAIIVQSGTKIKLPIDTRWCTYRDTFKGYIRNLQQIKNIIAEGSHKKSIPATTIRDVYDEGFENKVRQQILLMDPICKLIQNCQSLKFSIADSCEAWEELIVPDKFSTALFNRKCMAINIYCKVANYLDPRYRGQKLSFDDIEEVEVFLIGELDAQGIDSFQKFKNKSDFSEVLEAKNITFSVLYWKCALSIAKHQHLAKLALKIITIPASSGEIERVFSNWKFIHGPLRNRLNFQNSKKLVEVYYNINKMNDTESDTEEDFEGDE